MVNDGVLNTTQHSQRGNIYRLLAECYRYPSKELGNELELLERETQGLDPGLGIRGKELKNGFDPSESGLAHLGIAFSKLFVGPFELMAAPYGSVYLDENQRAMGDSTMRVIQYYIDAGLNPSDENKEPPDHISSELEFMYYLAFRYLETGDSQFLEKQRQFLLTQIHLWVPKFTSDIVKSQIHPFFSSLASLTNDFIDWEVNQLKK
jgi:TorA maturation chaperone TorD